MIYLKPKLLIKSILDLDFHHGIVREARLVSGFVVDDIAVDGHFELSGWALDAL